ncbi:MAG: helix-turn-helix transcriptional regulator [Tepidanaerobacteraceae bacterium]|nr:helix-turn-helix transcriptional regulator [Tepidanaerobacteraceae bacterium]
MLTLELERRKRGLTQKQLGEKVGIGPAEISRMENGMSKPFPAYIERLSKFFNIPGDELFKEVE